MQKKVFFSSNYKAVVDFSGSGHYFLLSKRNAFSIDVTPWVNVFVRSYNFGLSVENNDLKETSVNHLFSVISGKLDTSVSEKVFLTSLGAIFVKNDDNLRADNASYVPGYEKEMVVAVATEDSFIFTKIILCQLSTAVPTSKTKLPVPCSSFPSLREKVEGIFSKRVSVPKLRLSKSMTEKEALYAVIKVVDRLIENLSQIKSVYTIVQTSVSNALDEAEDLDKKELNHNQRLLEVVSEFTSLKSRIYSIRETLNKGKLKIDQLCGSFAARMFPISEAEVAMQKTLEDLQTSVKDCTQQIPLLASQVAAERRRRFGVTKSFHSSVSAKRFMLSKSSDEIDGILTWVKQLNKKIDHLKEITANGQLNARRSDAINFGSMCDTVACRC